ncbi:calpain-like protease palB [Ceratobasidium theobromae]|uniref:Calpain-like protease palB n=1 Tax=Ceratobasidium theobromae TaxID=1582974 RepID=A0A5N5QRL5_9AGAM|nr:calpain-like protease palB [Ceratobasidium theobromae]
MSMANASEAKLLADAQATLARATQKEHVGQLDTAYQLYIQSAKDFVHIASKSTRLETRNVAKASGSRALERANLIKRAAREEQLYILKQSSRVNDITLPIWSSNSSPSCGASAQSGLPVFIDKDGAPQLSPAHNAALAEWKHPPSELPLVDLDTPDEIVQDVVSDCSVIAALGVCEEHRHRFKSCLALRSIYPQNEQGIPFRNPQGKYSVRMMFNGAWRMVCYRYNDQHNTNIFIDELLPTAPDGRLICATTVNRAQLWPALVEKAYMKLMGGYDFPGSNSSIDLHALTSWIPEHMYLNGDDFQREKSWKRIYDGFINGKALLTLGTGETVTGEGRWKDILIAAHNYAIVGLEDNDVGQNLKVLNPWRRTNASQGGGLVTISWGLVCNLFESVYLNWNPDSFPHSKIVHGMWRERTAESGEHAASNHHYRLRYSNPETVASSDPPEIWVLLTRHVLSKRTKADFIALHYFSHVKASKLPRADQVPTKGTYYDSPHVLVRIKGTPPSEVISLVAARDGSGPETGYTLSIYSQSTIEIEAVTKVLGYIKMINGVFTGKTAGGNSSLATFMNNPQYCVRIGQGTIQSTGSTARARIPVKLTVEGARTLPLNLKLVWSGGRRVSDVVIGDVVIDSGAYSFGIACVEGEVPSGEYTLVVSSFRAGQLGEYALRIECDASVDITHLSSEGAGMFHKTVKGAWDERSAAGGPSSDQASLSQLTKTHQDSWRSSSRLQMISSPPLSPAPALNLTLFERNAQGLPGKQVATSGAYSDAVSGVLLPNISLRPGTYLFVPSTYYPGVIGDFQILLYATTNTLNPVRIR